MNRSGLVRVSRQHPCPICGRADWCGVFGDGDAAICMRVSSNHRTRNGGFYHKIKESRRLIPAPKTRPSWITTPPSRASLSGIDRAYRRLLELLPLSGRHNAQLLVRDVSPAEQKARGYRSLPAGSRTDTCRRLLDAGYELQGVPGFYREGRRWNLAGPPGLLISVRDENGLIQGLQIRKDDARHGAKYLWLSSAGRPGGVGSRSPVHVARPQQSVRNQRLWITEGPLKGDIASDRLGAIVIAVPGVATWRRGLEVAQVLDPSKSLLVIAFDMDFKTNSHVAQCRNELLLAAGREGWKVEAAEWEDAKGIDDALVAGSEVRVRPVQVVAREAAHARRILLPRKTVLVGGHEK